MQLIHKYVNQYICLHLKQLQTGFFSPHHIESILPIHFSLPLEIPSKQENSFLTSDPFILFPRSCQEPSNVLLLLIFSLFHCSDDTVLCSQSRVNCCVHGMPNTTTELKAKWGWASCSSEAVLSYLLLQVSCLPQILLFTEFWCKVQAKSICKTMISQNNMKLRNLPFFLIIAIPERFEE